MVALFSIKPEYVEKIFSNEKLYEYRKVIFKKRVQKIVVYSTMPVGMIVGEFDVDDVLVDRPSEIWDQTKSVSGVEETFFRQYFQGREKGYAIKIGNKKKYSKPVDPKELFDSFIAPQSFKYLDDPVKMG
ncbi:MAG: hypothetical protein H6667_25795 [Ardenticatenaceae bacterium]|nr:hypothetical protein [Ardenticatenaceae bacterium]MCB9445475.1 hypothetical protein [Ardenticatenaceae bacterium]